MLCTLTLGEPGVEPLGGLYPVQAALSRLVLYHFIVADAYKPRHKEKLMTEPIDGFDELQETHRSTLFTVRVWQEDLGEGQSEWRGKVQHVLNGDTRYFRDWQTLIAFIVESATPIQRVDTQEGG